MHNIGFGGRAQSRTANVRPASAARASARRRARRRQSYEKRGDHFLILFTLATFSRTWVHLEDGTGRERHRT